MRLRVDEHASACHPAISLRRRNADFMAMISNCISFQDGVVSLWMSNKQHEFGSQKWTVVPCGGL